MDFNYIKGARDLNCFNLPFALCPIEEGNPCVCVHNWKTASSARSVFLREPVSNKLHLSDVIVPSPFFME